MLFKESEKPIDVLELDEDSWGYTDDDPIFLPKKGKVWNSVAFSDTGSEFQHGKPRGIHADDLGRFDEKAARTIIEKFSASLEKRLHHPVSSIQFLGKGDMGCAFSLGDKVLKITIDDSEARASNKLKGKHLERVVKIFDVFRFKDTDVYGIHQEKLEKLSNSETHELREATVNIDTRHNLAFIINITHFDWKTMKDYISSKCQDSVRKLAILKKFGIPQMMEELEAEGIRFHDYHPGNIMKSGDVYKVIDLGVSAVAGGQEPDILEGWGHYDASAMKDDLESAPASWKSSHARRRAATRQLLNNIDGILRYFGPKISLRIKQDIKNFKKLGSQTRGVAYDIGHGKVLKITTDRTEALAANKLVGEKLKHFSNFFDVFKFHGTEYYGIVEEKLIPLSAKESGELDRAISYFQLNMHMERAFFDLKSALDAIVRDVTDHERKQSGLDRKSLDPDQRKIAKENYRDRMDTAGVMMNRVVESGILNIFLELKSHGIYYSDVHSGNLMKRANGTIVGIDPGYSDVEGGKEPDVLEKKRKTGILFPEAKKIDSIGVTIGRFQPFHAGHAKIVRDLCKKYTRVILIVTGGGKDKKSNPLDWDLRREIIQASLPDVMTKVELHHVKSGYLPDVISDIMINTNSALEGGQAFDLLVGEDRAKSFRDQLDRSKSDGKKRYLDPDLVTVSAFPDFGGDDAGRISGKKVREAIQKDDIKTFQKLMDPHLSSDQAKMKELFQKCRTALDAKEGVSEASGGGQGAMGGSIGAHHSGVSAGSSGWSSAAKARSWDDEEEPDLLWQDKLKQLPKQIGVG